MRLRSRSYASNASVDYHKTKKAFKYSLRALQSPSIRKRLRSFNGARTPNRVESPKNSMEMCKWNVTSDAEDRENIDGLSSTSQPKKAVLSPIYSPRRFRSVSKDQAAKIKRLNARKIEFDMEDALNASAKNESGNNKEPELVS